MITSTSTVVPLPGPGAWVLLLSLAAAGNASAAVYRCDEDGAPSFSQFPCGEGTTVVVGEVHTVAIPPLSESERRLLDDLERQRLAAEKQRARARRQAARRARTERTQRRQRCDAVHAAQAALAQQRRKGYGIDQARELDRRADSLKAEEKRNC